MKPLTYRVNYTIRIDGPEPAPCHYCENRAGDNALLERLEEWQAWGISIHQQEG